MKPCGNEKHKCTKNAGNTLLRNSCPPPMLALKLPVDRRVQQKLARDEAPHLLEFQGVQLRQPFRQLPVHQILGRGGVAPLGPTLGCIGAMSRVCRGAGGGLVHSRQPSLGAPG